MGTSVAGRCIRACRLPAPHAGNVSVQLGTQIHSRVVDALTRDRGIKIQLIARRAAAETVIHIAAQMYCEGPAPGRPRTMHWASTAERVCRPHLRNKADQVQDFLHGNRLPHRAKINAGHRKTSPCQQHAEQRRGTRTWRPACSRERQAVHLPQKRCSSNASFLWSM